MLVDIRWTCDCQGKTVPDQKIETHHHPPVGLILFLELGACEVHSRYLKYESTLTAFSDSATIYSQLYFSSAGVAEGSP